MSFQDPGNGGDAGGDCFSGGTPEMAGFQVFFVGGVALHLHPKNGFLQKREAPFWGRDESYSSCAGLKRCCSCASLVGDV